jgi:hypothetical protein
MKHLRRICGGLLLVLALSVPTLAGDMSGPGVTDGPQESPGVMGPQESPGVAGDIQMPGLAGDILIPGIGLILALL